MRPPGLRVKSSLLVISSEMGMWLKSGHWNQGFWASSFLFFWENFCSLSLDLIGCRIQNLKSYPYLSTTLEAKPMIWESLSQRTTRKNGSRPSGLSQHWNCPHSGLLVTWANAFPVASAGGAGASWFLPTKTRKSPFCCVWSIRSCESSLFTHSAQRKH